MNHPKPNPTQRMFKHLSEAISLLARELCESREQRKVELEWFKSHFQLATKLDLEQMEKRIVIKVSEVKTAVAQFKQQNREALAEIGTQIADLNKQIADLIAGVGDPEVTDEAFELDLRDLAADAKALADIVPGTPTPEPPTPEPPPA